MILHFVTDDKFTDYVINQFSSTEMKSEFALIPSNFNGGESLVRHLDKCKVIHCNSPEFEELLQSLGKYTAIVIHGMFWPWTETILKSVPNRVKVAWMFWGGEIYSRKDLFISNLAVLTKLAYKGHLFAKKTKDIQECGWELPIELYQRIDFCLTGEAEEYEYACNYLNNHRMEHIWYTYYSIEETLGGLMNSKCNGNNILFCNSAAVENNMFDAIFKLADLRNRKYVSGRKIIMPMGYGAPWIKNSMTKLGKFLFGKKFIPIRDFLPREEYNTMMTQCSTLILPYWTPAGQGNIITGLWLGMRVYLSDKSIAFNFFKRIGVHIFSLEHDFSKYHYSPLSTDEKEKNREVMREWYSKEHVQQSAANVAKILSTPK